MGLIGFMIVLAYLLRFMYIYIYINKIFVPIFYIYLKNNFRRLVLRFIV
jgi:hypothetical protein